MSAYFGITGKLKSILTTVTDILTKVNADPTNTSPIASGLVVGPQTSGGAARYTEIDFLFSRVAAGGSHTYTGAGVLELVVQDNSTGSPVSSSVTVTIDGAVVFASGTYSLNTAKARSVVGVCASGQMSLASIPFNTSLTIAGTGVVVYYRYYKTS